MSKFRKKPNTIHAFTYDEVSRYLDDKRGNFPDDISQLDNHVNSIIGAGSRGFLVKTLEGDMVMGPTDRLIVGTHGEVYPIKEEIFQANYEAA